VIANIGPVPESLGVSPFYTKYADALGIPVIASAKVPDAALLVARDIVNSMLAARPDIRKALIACGWRTCSPRTASRWTCFTASGFAPSSAAESRLTGGGKSVRVWPGAGLAPHLE
jgi:hypothetical protein